MVIDITATLNNWFTQQTSEKSFVVWGEIANDIHGRFEDGTNVHTSGIKNRSVKEGDIVKTKNSTYLLGKHKFVDKD